MAEKKIETKTGNIFEIAREQWKDLIEVQILEGKTVKESAWKAWTQVADMLNETYKKDSLEIGELFYASILYLRDNWNHGSELVSWYNDFAENKEER